MCGSCLLLSKKSFIKALTLIKEQETINDEVSKALDKVSAGPSAYIGSEQYLSALLLVLKEAMDDEYDYIEWWLYDATEDFRVEETTPEGRSWELKTPEALYDYLLEMKIEKAQKNSKKGE